MGLHKIKRKTGTLKGSLLFFLYYFALKGTNLVTTLSDILHVIDYFVYRGENDSLIVVPISGNRNQSIQLSVKNNGYFDFEVRERVEFEVGSVTYLFVFFVG